MLLFTKKEKKNQSSLNYLKFLLEKIIKQKKVSKIILFAFFIFFAVFTTPLNFWNKIDKWYLRGIEPLRSIDKKTYYLTNELHAFGDNLFSISSRFLNSQFVSAENLQLNLSFKQFSRLKNLRDKAMKNGIILRSPNDEFSGSLSFKDKEFPVNIRLKGDWTDHILGEKWSFRVKTKKDKFFKGMSEFSLQHPRTRNYINEFVFHKLLQFEKLPYLRYEFIPFYINGKYLGTYALEEHFSKRLIENSRYREGPIIKLSDQDLRNEWLRTTNIDVKDKNYIPLNKNNADIDVFNTKQLSKNKYQLSQFNLAASMLDKFLKKELKASEVFDIKTTAKYLAISDFMQSAASNSWYDMRFYFNPVIARLTPIGYDSQAPIKARERVLSSDLNILELFNDDNFFKEYLKNLERISKTEYFQSFKKFISDDLSYQLKIINKSYPHVKFMEQEFLNHQKYIRTRLNPLNPVGVSISNPLKDKMLFALDFYNKSSFPIEINKVEINGNEFIPYSEKDLQGSKSEARINNKKIIFRNNNAVDIFSMDEKNILIEYKIKGTNTKRSKSTKLLPWVETNKNDLDFISRKANYREFSNLKLDESKKEIRIDSDFILEKPLIINNGYKLIINPGVTITTRDKGYLFVEGSINILGENKNPVVFKGENNGKGIFVINSQDKSFINNTIFNNLSSFNEPSINLTGVVTFYNTEVEISDSQFINLIGEDGLNLINTKFTLKNSKFENLMSDALDLDFSDGKITKSTFTNIGNDAVDVSGANVQIKDIFIYRAGDKAISAGEESNVNLKGAFISNSFIGIASKDMSKVDISNLKTNKLNYCLAAYQKKGEYGPGFINIEKSDISCDQNYLLESNSSILYNKKYLKNNTNNAYKKIYQLSN